MYPWTYLIITANVKVIFLFEKLESSKLFKVDNKLTNEPFWYIFPKIIIHLLAGRAFFRSRKSKDEKLFATMNSN